MHTNLIRVIIIGNEGYEIFMIHGKFVTIVMLLLIPLLVAAPMAAGQTYSTQTITLVQTRTIFSAPITIPPTHGVCGVYFVQAFNSTTGTVVSGTLTSDNTVDFYLMTDTAFQAWTHQIVAGGICTPANLILKQLNTTSYNFSTTITTNGLYDIVLNNLSHSTVNAQLKIGLVTSAPAVVTTILFSTMTQPTVRTLTQITTQMSKPDQGSVIGSMALPIVTLIIVIAAAMAFVVMKKRSGLRAK